MSDTKTKVTKADKLAAQARRKKLIDSACEKYDYPFVIYDANDDEQRVAFRIQTPADERMFVNYGASHVDWRARDLRR